MRINFHTYRNLRGHVRKFTGTRKEISAHTYAISRENVNHPVAGRSRPVLRSRKQPWGLTSKGVANEKAFDTESIKPHVIITPGVEFKERMHHISYEREVKKKKP